MLQLCHIAAVVFYLSRAIYLEVIVSPASFLNKLFVDEELIPVINDDSEQED